MTAKREYLILFFIALAGTALRFVRLGELSFSADEELTALATQALLDGWPPTLPGGLVYLRALAFTALESVAVTLGGTQEGVLRIIPVIFAFPRIVAIWWLARAFLPAWFALACAGLLAVAPFDIEYSRVARMYSPFATLDLLFVAAMVRLSLNCGSGIGAAAFGFASASMHTLTIVHAPLAWLGALGSAPSRTVRLRLGVVGAVTILAFFLFAQVDHISYAPMGLNTGSARLLPEALRDHLVRLSLPLGTVGGKLVAATAALLAVVLIVRSFRRLTHVWSRVLMVAAGCCFVIAAPVLGSAALVSSFMLEGLPYRTPPAHSTALRHPLAPCLAAGVLLSTVWAALAVATHPPEESALRAGALMLIGYPAPNWLDVVRAAPALSLLAAIGIAAGAWTGARDRKVTSAWLIVIAAAIAPALATGMVTRSEAIRLQVHALAPILVLGVYGAWSCTRNLRMPLNASIGVTILVALLAVRPDRGIAILFRDHGPIQEPFAYFEVAPDHRGAGRFVREHASPDDWIVAEDSTQQLYYAGRTDYWLRREKDAKAFLANMAPNEAPRDIYSGAVLVPDFDALLKLSARRPMKTVWVITSAEAEPRPQFYRTSETSQALERIKPLAVFTGDDGLTRVYRIRDGKVEPPAGTP